MEIYGQRRARLLDAIHPGVLVVFSAPLAIRNNDVEHEYRQASDFYYLTGFDEPESVLVLSSVAEKERFVLFVRPRDPERETWDGRRAGVEGATERFGADAAHPVGELAAKLPDLLLGSSRLVYALGASQKQDEQLLSALNAARRRKRRGAIYPTSIVHPETTLHEQRLLKQPDEIEIMRRAAAVTGEAHLAAMQCARPGMYEFEIDGLLRGIFRRSGAERPAYEPIVGSGPNATILHHRRNDRLMQDGDLVLIDAGCELGYYASDVTRTFPVNGRFSAEQRVIYEIVLEAHERAIERTVVGASLEDVHQAAVDVVTRGLLELGLIDGPRDSAISEKRYEGFFMHQTSHWLGMDVHDVGAYQLQGKSRPLVPGMVLTVEPGIYVPEQASGAAERFRGIGVRIEDDVLVTEAGPDVLTGSIPRSLDAVERACQR
jgi:Xaa-Pro aminopeptidase